MTTHVEDFRAAMSKAGLVYGGLIFGDGKVHRFKSEGDSDAASWYVLYGNDPDFAAGAFGCWRRQFKENWHSTNGHEMSNEERQRIANMLRDSENARKTEEEKRHSEAKSKASQLLSAASPATPDHPYLTRKKVGVHGRIRIDADGCLVLPVDDVDGHLQSLQLIAPDKRFGIGENKRDRDFLVGGKMQGSFYTIANTSSGPLIICEGYSTGASIFEATGWSTVCAMFCGNLLSVATALRKKYPHRNIIIAADNDRFNSKQGQPHNPGVLKAEEAAKAIRAFVAVPEFADEDLRSSDFNDLAAVSGPSAVRATLMKCLPIIAVPIGDLRAARVDDPTELLKNRFLCQKMAVMLAGATGKGKSSLALQAFALWANNRECFDIVPARPLRTIYVQAENDDGDIAAIRDGICKGLEFTENERRIFCESVLVFTETALSGKRFCQEVLRKLLDFHEGTDILAIDPALSYLGGDVRDQKDVGSFLRNHLSPILHDYNCGGFILHHASKPPPMMNKRSFGSYQDFAYYGTGSIEWANWARGVLALESTPVKGIFKLHAGKRGQKLGWKDADGKPIYSKAVAHSKDPHVIFWREPSPDELPQGRDANYDPEAVAELLEEKSLSTSEWQKEANDELGLSRATFFRAKKELEGSERVIKSKINKKWQLVTEQQGKLDT
jgi:phage/plasmid primase-like uncharacterized protein